MIEMTDQIKTEPTYERDLTGLLIVDPYNDFLSEGGKLYELSRATLEAHDAKIDVVLSDNGREFCGRPDRHPYELFQPVEEIEHHPAHTKRPQSNGLGKLGE